MSFFPSPPLFLHPSTNWNLQPQADPQLSDSFVVVDGQYEAGAPVRPSESSSALPSCAERARAAKMAAKSSPEHAVLECPRCKSTNTKFCYYNNYSRSQPRHLCKTCRRHWTHGGALRNVPVGGGSRRSNKKAAKHSKPETATANYRSSPLSVPSSRRLPQQIDNDNDGDSNNQNHTVIHNFVFGQRLPGVGMAAPQPCPNLYTTFGEENVGATVKKMEEIGYVPRGQISYDPSNNNYNDMFLWGGSGSSNCIAWPSGSSATGFSYGSSSPHHISFMDSDMP